MGDGKISVLLEMERSLDEVKSTLSVVVLAQDEECAYQQFRKQFHGWTLVDMTPA